MIEYYETSRDLVSKQRAELEGILFGYEDCAPGHGYGPTFRTYHLFHFVTRGEGRLKTGGETYRLGPGDAFLIPAEQLSYYEASDVNPWSYSWAGVTGLRAGWCVQQILEVAPERYVLRGLDTEKYAASIQKAAHLEGTNTANYYRVGATLCELFSYLATDLPALGASGYTGSLARRIKFYLDARYTERLHLNDVAAQFHVHPNHLSRLFRAEFGIAPKQYLMQRKLEKAELLLRETDTSVNLIAVSLGFEDQHSFSRAFKIYKGISPTEYRRNQAAEGTGSEYV